MDLTAFAFAELKPDDDLSSFDCGEDDADISNFLKEDSKFYQREGLANTYLFWNDKEVGAYFSISNDCLSSESSNYFTNNVWNKIHRKMKLPNAKRIRAYPAVLVGRLGVHIKYQGKGTAYQLMDFIKEFAVSDCKPSCRLLLLDAVNKPRQIKYYLNNKFTFLFSEDEEKKNRSMYYDLERLRD